MIKSFLLSFKIKNCYKVNSIIYFLRQIPIVKKILSDSLYNSSGLKLFANIISGISEFLSIFIWKLLYFVFVFVGIISLYKGDSSLIFLNMFLFLTIIGGILNSDMFNPSKDKYYAIILMKFDSKKYTLSNYYYFLFKTFIGFIPVCIVFGLINDVNLLICLLLPLFVVLVKITISCYMLFYSNKKGKVSNENKINKYSVLLIVLLLFFAFGLPYFNITINYMLFYIIFGIVFVLGIISFFYILKFDNYRNVYKKLLIVDDIIYIPNVNNELKSYQKIISYDDNISSNKTGIEYFNDIFVKRHKKLLYKSTKNICIALLVIFVILFILIFIQPSIGKELNNFILTRLPYFSFILYFINRGEKITNTMFMNCDHAMLSYRFYRQPIVIFKLFKERLKTLVKINILPSLLIGIGLCLLLLFSGGVSNSVLYLLVLSSVVLMSIFFSIHYLVLYYLFQPYNIEVEMKSPIFSLICSFTYVICYGAISLKLNVYFFSIFIIVFTVLYCLIALFLTYKFAVKTFRLKI